jgi:hypothetical protein
VLVSSSSLLIRGILAALRQKFHLSTCPNLASHLWAHPNVVVVALAAKLARIAWAVLRHGSNYDHRAATV